MAERHEQHPVALVGEEQTQEDTEHPVPQLERSPTQNDAPSAVEMERMRRNYSRISLSRRTSAASIPKKPADLLARLTYSIRKFWRHQISITVEHATCRDHLALERTYLGYLRTSLALSMMGIAVAQLFRLQHSPSPNMHIGFYVLGKPIACICQGSAICTLAIGSFRTWRSQNAMVRGKAISGGFEIVILAAGICLLLITFTVLLIAVDVLKEDVT